MKEMTISLFDLVFNFVSKYGDKNWLNDLTVQDQSFKIGDKTITSNMHPWFYLDVLDQVYITLRFDLEDCRKYPKVRESIFEDIGICNWLRNLCREKGTDCNYEYSDPWREGVELNLNLTYENNQNNINFKTSRCIG